MTRGCVFLFPLGCTHFIQRCHLFSQLLVASCSPGAAAGRERRASGGATAPSLSQVNTSFAAWKTTKWQDINVEQMDIDCKKFAKDVRSLDKEMKSWDAFVGLDNTVKNMITALRAVSELQNPAIRDRHWQQLMQATQVPCATGGGEVLAAG